MMIRVKEIVSRLTVRHNNLNKVVLTIKTNKVRKKKPLVVHKAIHTLIMESNYKFLPKASWLFSALEETKCICLWITCNNVIKTILLF